ncbi:M23 family metallopeptidase [Gloeobacter kilaueensis]|uniref:Peptidase n=1 Tax=Gloeobacter kilaueensis (strain ATCC BAA-2537 / CCAP 1431/1 / ULC 316 / JS1) TaxID=1183438 RepID=U5QIF7_GLOK1|nr:M23 family metallopeptidase [Gloeobacter kilaueensis]AGY58772.1 peptidase [Gloeobacter kilaueensis JS1]
MPSRDQGSGCLSNLFVLFVLVAGAYFSGTLQPVLRFLMPSERRSAPVERKAESKRQQADPSPSVMNRPTVSLPALATAPGTATGVRFELPFVSGRCYRVSQGNNGQYSHHELSNRYAWDFSMPVGTPVTAAAAGQVIESAGPGAAEGSARSLLLDHGGGIYTLYAHLSQIKVKPGQRVSAGEVIALSGQDAGLLPHLHYGAFTLYPVLTSLPSRFGDDRQDKDEVPRQRQTYCATGIKQRRTNPVTALRANTFARQGIRLSTATPAHVLMVGQSYRLEGQSDRPLAPVYYQVRTTDGELLASDETYSNLQGYFGMNVQVRQGRPGEAITQLIYSDPNRMGSAVSAILAGR